MERHNFDDLLSKQKEKAQESLQNLGFSEKKKLTVSASASVSKKKVGANMTIKV